MTSAVRIVTVALATVIGIAGMKVIPIAQHHHDSRDDQDDRDDQDQRSEERRVGKECRL